LDLAVRSEDHFVVDALLEDGNFHLSWASQPLDLAPAYNAAFSFIAALDCVDSKERNRRIQKLKLKLLVCGQPSESSRGRGGSPSPSSERAAAAAAATAGTAAAVEVAAAGCPSVSRATLMAHEMLEQGQDRLLTSLLAFDANSVAVDRTMLKVLDTIEYPMACTWESTGDLLADCHQHMVVCVKCLKSMCLVCKSKCAGLCPGPAPATTGTGTGTGTGKTRGRGKGARERHQFVEAPADPRRDRGLRRNLKCECPRADCQATRKSFFSPLQLETFKQNVYNSMLLASARTGNAGMVSTLLYSYSSSSSSSSSSGSRLRNGTSATGAGANTATGAGAGADTATGAGTAHRARKSRDCRHVQAEINCLDQFGHTPLYLAAKRGQMECVRVLVRMGADLEHRDNSGLSALAVAALLGNLEVTRFLCQEGARVTTTDHHGLQPLQYCSISGDAEMAVLLAGHVTEKHGTVVCAHVLDNIGSGSPGTSTGTGQHAGRARGRGGTGTGTARGWYQHQHPHQHHRQHHRAHHVPGAFQTASKLHSEWWHNAHAHAHAAAETHEKQASMHHAFFSSFSSRRRSSRSPRSGFAPVTLDHAYAHIAFNEFLEQVCPFFCLVSLFG
jgi:ankyrin repeat protein